MGGANRKVIINIEINYLLFLRSLCYLSESDDAVFNHSASYFINQLTSVSGGEMNQLVGGPRPLQLIKDYEYLLAQCFNLSERRRIDVEVINII